jgi:hypothetical protein
MNQLRDIPYYLFVIVVCTVVPLVLMSTFGAAGLIVGAAAACYLWCIIDMLMDMFTGWRSPRP